MRVTHCPPTPLVRIGLTNFPNSGGALAPPLATPLCDDATNNGGCDFDDGDCCGLNVDKQHCAECICYENLDCAVPLELIANSFCNDEANTAGKNL